MGASSDLMEMRPHLGYSTSLGSLIGDLPAKEEELLLMLSVLMNTESRLFHVRLIYFSELLIETNFAFSFVPRPLTATMIAIEIPAAIRPYSMAVAPDSSFRKRTKRFGYDKPRRPSERGLDEPSNQELPPR